MLFGGDVMGSDYYTLNLASFLSFCRFFHFFLQKKLGVNPNNIVFSFYQFFIAVKVIKVADKL